MPKKLKATSWNIFFLKDEDRWRSYGKKRFKNKYVSKEEFQLYLNGEKKFPFQRGFREWKEK